MNLNTLVLLQLQREERESNRTMKPDEDTKETLRVWRKEGRTTTVSFQCHSFQYCNHTNDGAIRC